MKKETQKNIVKILVGVVVLVGVLSLQRVFADNEYVQELAADGGYVGVAIFTLVNTFNYLVPIVTPTLTPTWVAAGLNPYGVVITMVTVISMTDIGFYVIGRYSHRFARQYMASRTMQRIRMMRERHVALPLGVAFLWLLFMPLPNEVITITLGILGYRFLSVGSIILVGNIIFNSYIAYQSLVIVNG